MKKLISILLLCVATMTQAYADDMSARAAAVMKVMPRPDLQLMSVPSADGFIANKMMLASLKAGTDSNAVNDIFALLQGAAPASLAVTGKNDSITLATLDRVFDKLKGKTVAPQELAYVGHDAADAALIAKAAEVGVKLVVVAYP